GLRGSCERKLPLAEYSFRRLPPLHAVGVSVKAAVDRNGDREEVSLVSQGIELTHGPVPGCYPESVLRHGSELRLLFEGETQRLPGGAIICAPRELDRAAAFVSPSVSWLRVAEVAPPFVGRAVSELLHIAEVKRLMPQLRQKCSHPRGRRDLCLDHRLDQEWKILPRLLFRQPRHDLAQLFERQDLRSLPHGCTP